MVSPPPMGAAGTRYNRASDWGRFRRLTPCEVTCARVRIWRRVSPSKAGSFDEPCGTDKGSPSQARPEGNPAVTRPHR